MTKNLSEDQKTFLDNYLVTASVSKASEAAGYSSNNYLILSNPQAKQYLKDKRRRLNNAIGLDFWWKAKRLATIVDSVVGDVNDPNSVDLQHANVAISAIAELNRMQGHHSPEKSIVVNMEQDEQLKLVNDLTMMLIKEKEKKLIEHKED
jgi:hypothetical protein